MSKIFIVIVSRLAGFQMPTQLLSHFPTSAGQRQKTRLKAHGSRHGQRNCFVSYCHGQNRLRLGKGDLICWQLQEGWQERIAKLKTLSISSSQVQFHFISESCIPSPPQAVQGDGEQGLCSIHDCSSLPLHPFHFSPAPLTEAPPQKPCHVNTMQLCK